MSNRYATTKDTKEQNMCYDSSVNVIKKLHYTYLLFKTMIHSKI